MFGKSVVYLLVFMVYGDKPSMTTQEFLSEKACEHAALLVRSNGGMQNRQNPNHKEGNPYYTAFCVPKA
jgi:hypothetical protein